MALPLPTPFTPIGDDAYFEALTKLVFQAGFRWDAVERRWPAFQAAFDEFNLSRVAEYGPADRARLLSDAGIVRNPAKIDATITNAKVTLGLIAAHGSVAGWVSATRDLPWPERRDAVAKPFQCFGTLSAGFFLWTIGEDVPVPVGAVADAANSSGAKATANATTQHTDRPGKLGQPRALRGATISPEADQGQQVPA